MRFTKVFSKRVALTIYLFAVVTGSILLRHAEVVQSSILDLSFLFFITMPFMMNAVRGLALYALLYNASLIYVGVYDSSYAIELILVLLNALAALAGILFALSEENDSPADK